MNTVFLYVTDNRSLVWSVNDILGLHNVSTTLAGKADTFRKKKLLKRD